ncbi:Copia protein (Gag-int-pol protein) [Abeliophyllum distichum]|uniref:Copia protein (Gag-int-pol protein) n=1 Tax=Abeliophyllum distichum TaxID=126358 RepID=A0ABD1SB69_9LAMI
MKVIISKHVIFLEKEFILREASGSKVDLEEIQQTTNKIDQLDKPMAELAFDEEHIRNGEPSVSEDTAALHVKTAFLNRNISEDVYMTQPEGFESTEPNKSNKDDSKSQSGYVITLNGGAVSWKSSKKEITADSTTKIEYIVASEAAKEAIWIKKFISELGVVPSIGDPISLYCDNNGAIEQATEPRSHQRSKHILRRYHLIREIIMRNDIKIEQVPTDDNVADPLTKSLFQHKHNSHAKSISIRYMSNWI